MPFVIAALAVICVASVGAQPPRLTFDYPAMARRLVQQLALKPGERVHRVHNVLKLAGKPVIFDELRVAAARFPDLSAAKFGARDGTIYGLYQANYGINVVRISERLSAALAPPRIADVLGLTAADPVLVIKRVAYTYHDEPVELRTSWVNTHDHEYLSDLWKSEPR